ncbi:phospholipase C [Pseudomonas sp. TCU-HL1]|nr:phospholipase C [Pseudomonas sp. TCU-HL1]
MVPTYLKWTPFRLLQADRHLPTKLLTNFVQIPGRQGMPATWCRGGQCCPEPWCQRQCRAQVAIVLPRPTIHQHARICFIEGRGKVPSPGDGDQRPAVRARNADREMASLRSRRLHPVCTQANAVTGERTVEHGDSSSSHLDPRDLKSTSPTAGAGERRLYCWVRPYYPPASQTGLSMPAKEQLLGNHPFDTRATGGRELTGAGWGRFSSRPVPTRSGWGITCIATD